MPASAPHVGSRWSTKSSPDLILGRIATNASSSSKRAPVEPLHAQREICSGSPSVITVKDEERTLDAMLRGCTLSIRYHTTPSAASSTAAPSGPRKTRISRCASRSISIAISSESWRSARAPEFGLRSSVMGSSGQNPGGIGIPGSRDGKPSGVGSQMCMCGLPAP